MNVFYIIIIILIIILYIYISSASGLFLATHTNPKCFFGYVDDNPGDIPSRRLD